MINGPWKSATMFSKVKLSHPSCLILQFRCQHLPNRIKCLPHQFSRYGSRLLSMTLSKNQPQPNLSTMGQRRRKVKSHLSPLTPHQRPGLCKDGDGSLSVSGSTSRFFLCGLDNTIAADIQSAVLDTYGDVSQLAWLGTGFPLESVATILTL